MGAPNVGKSSLVQALSSGLPEVCDYPFTTRSVKMGHFYVDGRRHQARPKPSTHGRLYWQYWCSETCERSLLTH